MNGTPTRGCEPRAHHFVPQCWLAGFTETGQKADRLWVTDLKKQKQWASSPRNAGYRRDFYRVSNPKLDPITFENTFSKIETVVAPILKSLYEKPRHPSDDDLEVLLFFAAFQFVRVPAFRPWVLKRADSLHRSWMAEAPKSPASWAKALKKAGIPADSPGTAYERMLKFNRNVIGAGEYRLSAENEWYLLRGFEVAGGPIIRSLRARHWGTVLSENGSFIGSDNPVVMDGPKDRMTGFKSADIVIFPVNRHVLLYGTNAPVRSRAVNQKLIAKHNSFTMLTAEQHLYSHLPGFCWLNEAGKYQTDWRLFSKEKF